MKIKKFEFNLVKKEHLFGLDENSKSMRDLGNIVVLVGKNGSGKTRILKCIQSISKNAKDYNGPGKIELEQELHDNEKWPYFLGNFDSKDAKKKK